MVFDVVDDFGHLDATLSLAELAQRVASKVLAPAASPAARVTGATSGVGPLASTPGMELGYIVPSVLRHGMAQTR
jgi:hypothetical protein